MLEFHGLNEGLDIARLVFIKIYSSSHIYERNAIIPVSVNPIDSRGRLRPLQLPGIFPDGGSEQTQK